MAEHITLANAPVDERLKLIRDSIRDNDRCDASKPGNVDLLNLLEAYVVHDTPQDQIDFLRGVLRVYREAQTDTAYQDFLRDKLTKDESDRIERFVHGSEAADVGKGFEIPHSIGVRDELQSLHQVNKAVIAAATPTFHPRTNDLDSKAEIEINGSVAPQDGFSGFVHRFAAFLFDHQHEDEVKIWDTVEFQNWGRTVSFTPRYTVWPRTTAGVINIVKFAIKENMTVRCSGYRHSWSPIFGQNGQILISMLDPDKVSVLPDTTSLPLWQSSATELESIDLLDDTPLPVTPGKSLVRVGAACTNERLRRWCVANNKVTIPLNVIMVEITLGGSNAPICHGAGRQHRTLSDLVRCIEYVDCHGKLQTVNDPAQLRAASGAFGLLGVVTHVTMEFDPMTYAQLAPKKVPVAVAIPPPDGYEDKVPLALRVNRTADERAGDIAVFEDACENAYYAEWFWFPYSDEAWVNTWNTTTDASDVVEFPSDVNIFVQWVGTVLFNIAQYSTVLDTIGDLINVDFVGTTIISRAAMWLLGDRELKTYLIDGLHFQRAIQNVRVRDMEVEIPIPAKDLPALTLSGATAANHQSDWTVARRAWWDAIIIAYEHSDTQPQHMPLEMRIMGDSDVILSPQRGNKFGTCSIEILTLEKERAKWLPYSQQVLDKWMSYTDKDGKKLRTRPHWAKEWAGHTVDNKPWKDVLKEQYKEEAREFRHVLSEIGKQQGWLLEDAKTRFGNDWLNELVFDGASNHEAAQRDPSEEPEAPVKPAAPPAGPTRQSRRSCLPSCFQQ